MATIRKAAAENETKRARENPDDETNKSVAKLDALSKRRRIMKVTGKPLLLYPPAGKIVPNRVPDVEISMPVNREFTVQEYDAECNGGCAIKVENLERWIQLPKLYRKEISDAFGRGVRITVESTGERFYPLMATGKKSKKGFPRMEVRFP